MLKVACSGTGVSRTRNQDLSVTSPILPTGPQHPAKPSPDVPHLLLVDKHISRKSLAVTDPATQNGVTMITFPPHSAHMLQPLDRENTLQTGVSVTSGWSAIRE